MDMLSLRRALEPQEREAAAQRMKAGKAAPSGKLPQGKGKAADKASAVTGYARRTLDKAIQVS